MGAEGAPTLWDELIDRTLRELDSVGGVIECTCDKVPVGLGEPFFDSLESQLAHLAFSIPAVRGIEFGDGFAAARMKGSEHNDCFVNGEGKTATNGAGGINGGISNGNPVVFRVAVKPTSSIAKKQYTFNFATGRMEEFVVKGRHDACIALRCPVVVEAIAAIDGVLNFENHDYLFFCARPTFDGYHSFARTYGEHLANARAYSAELNRRNIK